MGAERRAPTIRGFFVLLPGGPTLDYTTVHKYIVEKRMLQNIRTVVTEPPVPNCASVALRLVARVTTAEGRSPLRSCKSACVDYVDCMSIK